MTRNDSPGSFLTGQNLPKHFASPYEGDKREWKEQSSIKTFPFRRDDSTARPQIAILCWRNGLNNVRDSSSHRSMTRNDNPAVFPTGQNLSKHFPSPYEGDSRGGEKTTARQSFPFRRNDSTARPQIAILCCGNALNNVRDSSSRMSVTRNDTPPRFPINAYTNNG